MGCRANGLNPECALDESDRLIQARLLHEQLGTNEKSWTRIGKLFDDQSGQARGASREGNLFRQVVHEPAERGHLDGDVFIRPQLRSLESNVAGVDPGANIQQSLRERRPVGGIRLDAAGQPCQSQHVIRDRKKHSLSTTVRHDEIVKGAIRP